jgi:Raf kinase inhibitor-like YbhB/YbcL family protein
MIIAAVTAFTIASATFKPNTTMPIGTVYTQCGGKNVSPELHWSGAPKGTKSFALIVHDPDAPHPGGWYHWVLYDIPSATRSIAASFDPPRGHGKAPPWWGLNDFGDTAYDGPCPPARKTHHYHFTLYALDLERVEGSHLTGPQLLRAMAGHVRARATLTGLYRR